MTSHPNRDRKRNAPSVPHQMSVWMRDRERGQQPKPEQIRTLRLWTTATKPEMAQAMHRSLSWLEKIESGRQEMHCNDWFAMRCACHVMMSQMQAQAREIRERVDGSIDPYLG